jgi:hypothetical protein
VPDSELKNQKAGGIAALAAAAAFIFGFVFAVTALSDYAAGDLRPDEAAAFVADHEAALFSWNLVIYIVFGLVLIPLVLALDERLRSFGPHVMRTTTALGIIGAGLVLASGMIAILGASTVADLYGSDPVGAEPVWASIDSVQNALGGGNEVVGGLWVLTVSAVAHRASVMPSWLGYLGIGAGLAGIATIVPALEAVGALFGIGLIVWFSGLGLLMLRAPTAVAPGSRLGRQDPEEALVMAGGSRPRSFNGTN